MKIAAAELPAGKIVKIDGRMARVAIQPTATKYGMVKITLSGGRVVLANQDEPIDAI